MRDPKAGKLKLEAQVRRVADTSAKQQQLRFRAKPAQTHRYLRNTHATLFLTVHPAGTGLDRGCYAGMATPKTVLATV